MQKLAVRPAVPAVCLPTLWPVTNPSVFYVPELLHWREFDGSWVVYQSRSGVMAHLDHLSATVLSLLEAESLSAAALALQLAAEGALVCTDEFVAAVAEATESMCRAGFIAAVDGPPAW